MTPELGRPHSLDCICRLCEEREAIGRKLELERKAELFDKLVDAIRLCYEYADLPPGMRSGLGTLLAKAKGGAAS